MSRIFLISLFFSNLFSDQIYYEYGKKIELTPITQDKYKSISLTKYPQDTNNSIKYFKKSNAQIVGVDNTILAKSLDDNGCENILQKYNTLEFKTISKNIYLIYLQNQDEIFKNPRTDRSPTKPAPTSQPAPQNGAPDER